MRHTGHAPQNPTALRPATEISRDSPFRGPTATKDTNAKTRSITQRKQIEALETNPRIDAQRAQIRTAYGAIATPSQGLPKPTPKSQNKVVQRRPLNQKEREDLADAKDRLALLLSRFQNDKATMTDALQVRGGYANELGYFQKLGWTRATEEITRLDSEFVQLENLSRAAATNHKLCGEFISKVNFFDKSGGMNRFLNLYNNIETGLLSEERNSTNQFTKLDEIYFQKYLNGSKSPIRVYRGDGRSVTPDSFDILPFTNIPAGGTPDITFAGVVEHTHTNTLKNGMVSCTTDHAVALHFATEEHEYGVVWELLLDNYIHVTNLLKTRNFKYRFPGQYEVLYPGSIPKDRIVSATLYQKSTPLKSRKAQ